MTNYETYQEKLNILSKHAVQNFDDLQDALGIGLRKRGERYIGNCPIHEGANSGKFIFYVDGDGLGNYYCPTRECHSQFTNNVIGFTKAVLTNQNGGEPVQFKDVINFLCTTFDLDLKKIKVNTEEIEQKNFVKDVERLNKREKVIHGAVPLEDFAADLTIPSPYFTDRGVPEKILEKFWVGDYSLKQGEFVHRAVVPVIDPTGKRVIGATARSIYLKCSRCGCFHKKNISCVPITKWINSGQFAGSYLYNYFGASEHIAASKVAVLVEGQADIWRLDEAGIYNAVGVFGAKLTDDQTHLLERLGTMALVIVADNDEAGQACAQRIAKARSQLFHTKIVKISQKDVDEMSIEEIQTEIIPTIKKMEEKYK